ALRDLAGLPPGAIVVESGRTASGSAPPGEVRIRERHPEHLLLETDSPAPGWLFVLRGFWRHRVVRVDGVETEVFPAQLAYSAIAVPAGRHRVEWVESFPGIEISRFGPPLYFLALAGLFAARRRGRSPEPS